MKTHGAAEPRYNVACLDCQSIWQPEIRSPLWWRAQKHAEKGFLDALHVSGVECGCVQEVTQPEARYRVVGYNDLCEDFDIPFESLVAAARKYLALARDPMFVVFFIDMVATATGRQSAIEQRLIHMARV